MALSDPCSVGFPGMPDTDLRSLKQLPMSDID
jgi:hypothetical protein